MADTKNLLIPLLEGSHLVARDGINTALETVDTNALPKEHQDSSVHWEGWTPGSQYTLKEIIRLVTMPSWGYLECTIAGTSGVQPPPCPYSPGDTVADGSVVWTMRQIGGAVVSHGGLSGRALPDQHPIAAITGLEDELDDRQLISEKGQPSGYASLDVTGKIPITQLPANVKEMRVVADIPARNAISGADLYDGLRVRVLDATGDPTVTSGWAEYVYDVANTAWIKLSEKESMDIVLRWGNLQEVPDTLKKLDAAGGKLNYDGQPVYVDTRAVAFIGGESEIPYPWGGAIQQIRINCAEARAEGLVFSVETQAKADYMAKSGNWRLVGGAQLTLPAGQVYAEFTPTVNVSVAAGDIIRASTVGDDTGITFQVIIKNN